MLRSISIFGLLIMLSCSSNDDTPTYCISFDTRQCMGDPWATDVDRNSSAQEQASEFVAYLESQNITVVEVSVDLSFHEFTCEACFVCPENPRISVRADESNISKLLALDLLSPSESEMCTSL